MIFLRNLLKARHHVVFMLGLAAASYLIYHLEQLAKEEEEFRASVLSVTPVALIEEAEPRMLSEEELGWARIAWKYFENNTIPETGMVNSVDAYPASTMWDTASYMLGLISAYRLEIVDQEDFDERMNKILVSLATMDLYDDKLPNKSYNTHTLAMVDYENNATELGIGWSAIDVGRILVPLNILVWNFPQHTQAVAAVVARWDFEALLDDGVMMGAEHNDETGAARMVQEGRIGYEEYAAKTLSMMGFDVSRALRYADFLDYEDIYDIDVPIDIRDPAQYHAHNYVVSESYILDGVEFGWDRISKEFAHRVYLAQLRRWENTNQLTAVSEDNIDQAPYFVYNTVYSSGKAWNAITEDGEDASEFRTISTKAAFGWDALYNTEYTNLLINKVKDLHDEDKGWFSGWYEVLDEPNKAITANTNGIILETLAYRQFGSLVAMQSAPDLMVADSDASDLVADNSSVEAAVKQDSDVLE